MEAIKKALGNKKITKVLNMNSRNKIALNKINKVSSTNINKNFKNLFHHAHNKSKGPGIFPHNNLKTDTTKHGKKVIDLATKELFTKKLLIRAFSYKKMNKINKNLSNISSKLLINKKNYYPQTQRILHEIENNTLTANININLNDPPKDIDQKIYVNKLLTDNNNSINKIYGKKNCSNQDIGYQINNTNPNTNTSVNKNAGNNTLAYKNSNLNLNLNNINNLNNNLNSITNSLSTRDNHSKKKNVQNLKNISIFNRNKNNNLNSINHKGAKTSSSTLGNNYYYSNLTNENILNSINNVNINSNNNNNTINTNNNIINSTIINYSCRINYFNKNTNTKNNLKKNKEIDISTTNTISDRNKYTKLENIDLRKSWNIKNSNNNKFKISNSTGRFKKLKLNNGDSNTITEFNPSNLIMSNANTTSINSKKAVDKLKPSLKFFQDPENNKIYIEKNKNYYQSLKRNRTEKGLDKIKIVSNTTSTTNKEKAGKNFFSKNFSEINNIYTNKQLTEYNISNYLNSNNNNFNNSNGNANSIITIQNNNKFSNTNINKENIIPIKDALLINNSNILSPVNNKTKKSNQKYKTKSKENSKKSIINSVNTVSKNKLLNKLNINLNNFNNINNIVRTHSNKKNNTIQNYIKNNNIDPGYNQLKKKNIKNKSKLNYINSHNALSNSNINFPHNNSNPKNINNSHCSNNNINTNMIALNNNISMGNIEYHLKNYKCHQNNINNFLPFKRQTMNYLSKEKNIIEYNKEQEAHKKYYNNQKKLHNNKNNINKKNNRCKIDSAISLKRHELLAQSKNNKNQNNNVININKGKLGIISPNYKKKSFNVFHNKIKYNSQNTSTRSNKSKSNLNNSKINANVRSISSNNNNKTQQKLNVKINSTKINPQKKNSNKNIIPSNNKNDIIEKYQDISIGIQEMDIESSKLKSTLSRKDSDSKQQNNILEENNNKDDSDYLKISNIINYNSDIASISNKKHRHVLSTNVAKENINILLSPKRKSSPKKNKDEDPQYTNEYLEDILGSLLKEENYFLKKKYINPHYLENPDIELTPEMRTVAVDWLVLIHQKIFKFKENTLFLAVQLFDRFLTKTMLDTEKTELLLLTAFSLASKHEEIDYVNMQENLQLSQNKFKKEQVIDMEYEILKNINFEVLAPTMCEYFKLFASYLNLSDEKICHGFYIMNIVLVDFHMLEFPNFLLALAVVKLITKKINRKLTNLVIKACKENNLKVFLKMIDDDNEVILDICDKIKLLYDTFLETKYKNIQEKFAEEKYYKVSTFTDI